MSLVAKVLGGLHQQKRLVQKLAKEGRIEEVELFLRGVTLGELALDDENHRGELDPGIRLGEAFPALVLEEEPLIADERPGREFPDIKLPPQFPLNLPLVGLPLRPRAFQPARSPGTVGREFDPAKVLDPPWRRGDRPQSH